MDNWIVANMNLVEYAKATGVRPIEFQKKLAADHGIELDHETVRCWLNGKLLPGAKRMAAIEAVTDGKVTRYAVRPDIFGPPPKKRRAA